jgi:hypothetical protein
VRRLCAAELVHVRRTNLVAADDCGCCRRPGRRGALDDGVVFESSVRDVLRGATSKMSRVGKPRHSTYWRHTLDLFY